MSVSVTIHHLMLVYAAQVGVSFLQELEFKDNSKKQAVPGDERYLFDYQGALESDKIPDEICPFLAMYVALLHLEDTLERWEGYGPSIDYSEMTLQKLLLMVFSKQCHKRTEIHHIEALFLAGSVYNLLNYISWYRVKHFIGHCCLVPILKDSRHPSGWYYL